MCVCPRTHERERERERERQRQTDNRSKFTAVANLISYCLKRCVVKKCLVKATLYFIVALPGFILRVTMYEKALERYIEIKLRALQQY